MPCLQPDTWPRADAGPGAPAWASHSRCQDAWAGSAAVQLGYASARRRRAQLWAALNPFFGAQGEGFQNFVLHNCILVFDAEQVYIKLQVTNLKNKEVTVNPKPQTLGKNWFFAGRVAVRPRMRKYKEHFVPAELIE